MSNSKQKFLIRADGGKELGMGHVVRTGVLAKELSKLFEVRYIMLEEYTQGIEYIKKMGYKVVITSRGQLIHTILEQRAIGIITDNYNIDEEYINEVRKICAVVGYIDDNAERSFEADFILNQNFQAEKIIYHTNKECSLLLGSRYILLKDEYRQAKSIVIKKQLKEVLVTVGGGDLYNFTDDILKNVSQLSSYTFHVVIGENFPYEGYLKDYYKKYKHIRFHKQPNMCELMQKCDIAISSCGSTLYELGILGIPTIGISVVDNQIPLAKRMESAKCIVYVGDVRKSLIRNIGEILLEVIQDYEERTNMQQRCLRTLNKDGVELVVNYIFELVNSKLQ